MLAAIARLFFLRPLFTMAILGVPVIILIAVGLVTIAMLKFAIFVVLPIAVIIWVARKLFGRTDSP